MDMRQRTYLISIVQKAMDDCCGVSNGVVQGLSEEDEGKKDIKVSIIVVVCNACFRHIIVCLFDSLYVGVFSCHNSVA